MYMKEASVYLWWHGAGYDQGRSPIGSYKRILGCHADIGRTYRYGFAEKTDGISFLPTLLSKKDQQAHDYLYWEFHELNGREALRSGKWKLIRQPIVGETILELYDLSNDIHEDTNLAEKYPDKVKELAVLMDTPA